MTYHPSGQIATLIAKNATTGDQITRYIYGTVKAWQTPLIYRNDMLAAEIYPDSDDSENSSGILQNGSDGVMDRVEFQYNRIGERIAKRDQNGTIHTYEYDNLGRLLHDRITTLAANVDGAVRRISTVYDAAGNVKSVTSFDGSNNIVNQVMYEYDANGLLAKDYSNPSGAVQVASTPYIGYTYDVTKSGDMFTKRLRLSTMKYPSGKTLTYTYGTANSVDDLLGRLTEIKEGATSLVQYAYNGMATPVKTTYSQPGLALDYTASGALDRFGRITDHAWKKSSTNVVNIKHNYDRVGNRLYREDTVGTNFSEVYAYDGVNQLVDMQRGVINSAKTGISTKKGQEQFTFDATGNWGTYKQDNTGAGFTLNQTRTHNKANEIATIAGSATNVAADRNGNMTKLPKPDNWSAAFTCVFDAWNRLVQIKDGSTTIATYSYNGLNQRVKKTVNSVVTTSFYNSAWQELESVTSGTTSVYIWGNRYIDDLVLREKGAEKLYSLADPNWNVVATTNTSGTVQERIAYDAFGKPNWLNASFATKASSGFAWNRTFTGQVLDSESGLMLYRNRYYHTGLGRFVSRDPIGYRAGDVNVYRYVVNNSCNSTDVHGLQFDFSGDTRCTCERRLERALEDLKTEKPSAHKKLQDCNIDIQCTDDCAQNTPKAGAMYWYVPGGTHIHICFKKSNAGDGSQKDFTALLIHEMVHIEQELRNGATKRRFCGDKKGFGDGERPVPQMPDVSTLSPRERARLHNECARRESEAYSEQGRFLGLSRDALAQFVQNGIDSSCGYILDR